MTGRAETMPEQVAPLLTDDEHEAMRLSGQLANLCRRIIGNGPQAEYDWNEMAQRIHGVQHMILSQAAARAYPTEYRALGGHEAGVSQRQQCQHPPATH